MNTMTNSTSRESMLIATAKADCEKRKERKQKLDDFKQVLCWVLICFTVLFVVLQRSYPEIFTNSADTESKANAYVTEIEKEEIIANADETTNEAMQTTEKIQSERGKPYFPYSEPITEVVTKTESETNETPENLENEKDEATIYNLTEAEICMLVQAVQHETNNDSSYYVNGDMDTVQQLMTAVIINRIGEDGFGPGFTHAYTLTDVLSNTSQFENILNELDWYDPYNYRTRQNVMAVLTGEVWVPSDLYFERCSSYGEDWYTAQANFESQYNSCYTYYMSETWEVKNYYGTGVFIIFGCNPSGAF